jgi:hypothetical protein
VSDEALALIDDTQLKQRYDASVFWKILIAISSILMGLFIPTLLFIVIYEFDKEAGSRRSRRQMERKFAQARKQGMDS